MVDDAKPFELDQQSIDNLSIAPSLSKEYPETGYNFQDTAFLANQLSLMRDDCAFIDTKKVLLSETYMNMEEYIQDTVNGKSNVVTGEIFVNKGSEMLMLAPILKNAVIGGAEKIVSPLNLTYAPKESHAVALCVYINDDGVCSAVILEQHAQNKAKDKDQYKSELDYSEEISGVLDNISSFFGDYGITVNTKYNEKPICREKKVCGIVSMEACKRLLEADNPVILAEEVFSLNADDVKKLHNKNVQNYNRETMRDYVSEDLLSQEIYSFDMVNNEQRVGNIDISIHQNKIVSNDERQLYPNGHLFNSNNAFLSLEKESSDASLQKIYELQKRMQKEQQDYLTLKQNVMKQGLKDIGLSDKDVGKTGDSRTGQVTEKHHAIATSQIDDAKQIMLQRRLSKGK